MALTDRVTASYDCGPVGRAGQGGAASTKGNALQLTTGNIVAQDAALFTWAAALVPLTLGIVQRAAFDHAANITSSVPTATLNKGEKWVVSMRESSGNQRYLTHTIPAANKSGTHLITDTLDADLSDADWVSYTSAAQALLKTPEGNDMILIGATVMTRRR